MHFFSGFSTWGDVAIQLKLQAIEKKKQKQLGDFLLEVVKWGNMYFSSA